MLTRDPFVEIRQRLTLLALGVVAAAALLVWNLYKIQIQEGGKYTSAIRSQTSILILLPPARGIIYDRNGMPLVENKASIDLDVYFRELVGYYKRSHKGGLPMVEVQAGRNKTIKQIDVDKILKETSSDLFHMLNLEPTFTRQQILRHHYQTPNVPFVLVRNLDFTTLSIFEEKNPNIPGIEETVRPTRYYPYGALACHVLGFIGHPEEKPNEEEYQPDIIGKDGIEKTFDKDLQGEPGHKVLLRNQMGFIIREDGHVNPHAGNFVYLTIDARIQFIVERVLQKVGRGAAIVMDPHNGDILAMASVPNYDPNDFVPEIDPKKWKDLTMDPTHPLFNRAISAYPPGSIFKPITALAALENENLSPRFTANTIINSPGSIFRVGRDWKDWSPNGQGDIPLKMGLAMSCNTFFYQVGERTGIDSIADMGRRIGLGEKVLNRPDEVILPSEMSGTLPSPEWMDEQGKKKIAAWKKKHEEDPIKYPAKTVPYVEKWSVGHTLNTSIGQGYVAVTPLQMTMMTSGIANGGTVFNPRLILGTSEEVEDNGEIENHKIKEYEPIARSRRIASTPETIRAVKEGMIAVVEEGTGKKAAIPGVKVAGKTGTATFHTTIEGRKVNDLRTWFTGFAPYDAGPDDAQYVVTVLVEGGTSGGGTCAPLASEILSAIFEMKNMEQEGQTFPMTYLTPVAGHFGGVQELSEPTGLQLLPAVPPEANGAEPAATTDENAADSRIAKPDSDMTYHNVRGLRR